MKENENKKSNGIQYINLKNFFEKSRNNNEEAKNLWKKLKTDSKLGEIKSLQNIPLITDEFKLTFIKLVALNSPYIKVLFESYEDMEIALEFLSGQESSCAYTLDVLKIIGREKVAWLEKKKAWKKTDTWRKALIENIKNSLDSKRSSANEKIFVIIVRNLVSLIELLPNQDIYLNFLECIVELDEKQLASFSLNLKGSLNSQEQFYWRHIQDKIKYTMFDMGLNSVGINCEEYKSNFEQIISLTFHKILQYVFRLISYLDAENFKKQLKVKKTISDSIKCFYDNLLHHENNPNVQIVFPSSETTKTSKQEQIRVIKPWIIEEELINIFNLVYFTKDIAVLNKEEINKLVFLVKKYMELTNEKESFKYFTRNVYYKSEPNFPNICKKIRETDWRKVDFFFPGLINFTSQLDLIFYHFHMGSRKNQYQNLWRFLLISPRILRIIFIYFDNDKIYRRLNLSKDEINNFFSDEDRINYFLPLYFSMSEENQETLLKILGDKLSKILPKIIPELRRFYSYLDTEAYQDQRKNLWAQFQKSRNSEENPDIPFSMKKNDSPQFKFLLAQLIAIESPDLNKLFNTSQDLISAFKCICDKEDKLQSFAYHLLTLLGDQKLLELIPTKKELDRYLGDFESYNADINVHKILYRYYKSEEIEINNQLITIVNSSNLEEIIRNNIVSWILKTEDSNQSGFQLSILKKILPGLIPKNKKVQEQFISLIGGEFLINKLIKTKNYLNEILVLNTDIQFKKLVIKFLEMALIDFLNSRLKPERKNDINSLNELIIKTNDLSNIFEWLFDPELLIIVYFNQSNFFELVQKDQNAILTIIKFMKNVQDIKKLLKDYSFEDEKLKNQILLHITTAFSMQKNQTNFFVLPDNCIHLPSIKEQEQEQEQDKNKKEIEPKEKRRKESKIDKQKIKKQEKEEDREDHPNLRI